MLCSCSLQCVVLSFSCQHDLAERTIEGFIGFIMSSCVEFYELYANGWSGIDIFLLCASHKKINLKARDRPNRWQNMKDMINGTSKFRGEFNESNKWVVELKQLYDPVELKKEVEMINCPITLREFVNFTIRRGRVLSQKAHRVQVMSSG